MIPRNTRQRKLVLDVMRESCEHRTADEVYEIARKRSPNISRGTVYRNLNLLVEEGKIGRLSPDSGADYFDPLPHRHYHFCCRKCRRFTDIPLAYREEMDAPLSVLPGYKIEEHTLLLTGLCPRCGSEL